MKKILLGAFTILICVSLLTGAVCAADSPSLIADQAYGERYADQLTSAARGFYNDMETAIPNMKDGVSDYQFTPSVQINESDFYDIMITSVNALRMDRPDLYYIDFSSLSYGYSYYQSGVIASVTLSLQTGYTEYYIGSYTGQAQLEAELVSVQNVIDGIVAGAAECDCVYDKLLYCHDWLTNNNVYNSYVAAGDTDSAPESAWTIVSAFLSDNDQYTGPVCEGYAEAYKVLCDELDIPCVLIPGTASTSSGSGAHIWNAVTLGGAWYNTDVTWDDPLTNYTVTNNENVTHNYFLVGSQTVNGGDTYAASHIASTKNYMYAAFSMPTISETAYDKSACAHTDTAWITVTEPTCTSAGSKSRVCTVCGTVVETEEIPSPGHSYGVPEREDDENHICTCSACGDVKREPHSWDDGVITVEPTGSAEGEKTYTCSVCGATKTESVAPVATAASVSVTTPPTKTEYNVGAAVNTSGMVLTLTYSDGSTEEVTEGYTIGAVDASTAGTKTVTVTYEGLTCTFEVVYTRRSANITVTVTNGSGFTVAVNGGTAKRQGNYYLGSFTYGDSLTLSAVGTTDNAFKYWLNETNNIISRSETLTYTVTSTTKLYAVYDAVIEGISEVTFVGAYDQVLSSAYYAAGDDVTVPSPSSFYGSRFAGWSLNGTDVIAAAELDATIQAQLASGNNITLLSVYVPLEAYCTITVNGGKGGGEYAQRGHATITADEPEEEMKFAYWINGGGTIISYEAVTTLRVFSDMSVTAVFVAQDTEIEPVGIASIVNVSYDSETGKLTVISETRVSDGQSTVKSGIVATSDESVATGGGFTSANAAYTRYTSTTADTFYYAWTKTNVTPGDIWYVRGYLEWTDSEGTAHTTYSEHVYKLTVSSDGSVTVE